MSSDAGQTFFLPVWSLWAREVLRFVRQRNRIIGALGTPLLFWVLLGSGFGKSFRAPQTEAGMDYLEYFFPGAVLLVVLFTAIFSSMSIIEDRKEGFLQGVLVAPVPRLAIVLGKVLGGASLGLLQGLLILLLAPLIGLSYGPLQFLAAGGVIFLAAVGLSALGFALAWRMDSIPGFHAVMNLLLFPMWILSGAFFPATGASAWVKTVMLLNPLSYAMSALRRVVYDTRTSDALGDTSLPIALAVLGAFAGLALLAAAVVAGRPEKG